ncbi:MAG: hypothetical protein IPN94_20705 [Sphingobacteriales bacterium]|nr:hypothetical protein [Sphingobacteriales bacterium]
MTVTNSATLGNATPYTVIITDNNGCSTTATTLPIVNANPTVTVNSPTVCVGAAITLTATATGTPTLTYAWAEPSTGGTLTITNNVSTIASAVPGDAGPYTVVVTDANTCKATATATVVVNANPVPPALVGATYCLNASPVTALDATTAGATGYLWAPGGAITATLTPSVATSGTTVYTVTVTGAGGCTATRTATIGKSATSSLVVTMVLFV